MLPALEMCAVGYRDSALRPIFTVYVPRTSRALDVRGTRFIRPFDACTQQPNTWIPTEEFTACAVRTFVPRTSGPLLDAEIKMRLISALSVRHPSVFFVFLFFDSANARSCRCAYATRNFSIHLTYTYDVRVRTTHGRYVFRAPTFRRCISRPLHVRPVHIRHTLHSRYTYV
jgi:hypothetical protein